MAKDRILRYIYYGIIAAMAIASLVMIIRGTDENPNVSFSLWQAFIYAIVATGMTLIFAIVGLIFNFKANIKNIVALVVLVVAFFIFKGMASPDVPQKMIDDGITSATLTASQAGVMVSIFLIVVAIAITVISGIRGLFE